MGLLLTIKKEIKQNFAPELNAENITYYDYNENYYSDMEIGEIKTFENKIVEIDITAAYFYAAYNMKLISKETLNKCLDLPKKKRLPLLGGIAAKKIIFFYENGIKNDEKTIIKTDELLRNAWFQICKKVDDLIVDCKQICGKNFLFYYVDGIYFFDSEKLKQKIQNKIQNEKFKCKTLYIDELQILRVENSHILALWKDGKENPKIFTISNNKIKYIINE